MYWGGETENEDFRESRRDKKSRKKDLGQGEDVFSETELSEIGGDSRSYPRDDNYSDEEENGSFDTQRIREEYEYGHSGLYRQQLSIGRDDGYDTFAEIAKTEIANDFGPKISHERDLRPSQALYDIMIAPFSVGLGEDVCVKPRNIPPGTEDISKESIYELGSMLLVPPKRYSLPGSRGSNHFPIETEAKVLEAFESSLKTYRSNQEFYDRPKTSETGCCSSKESQLGCTTPVTIDGKDVRFSHGVRRICVYIWRPSPSLNWRIKGRLFDRKSSLKTVYEFGAVSREEYLTLIDKIIPGDKDVVPKELMISSTSPRLEIIMLAYRYASIILNVANREFNEVTSQDIYNASFHDMTNTIEAMRKMGDHLVRAFSMMKNVVEGLVSTWVTLEPNSKCAETTIEACHFMQHMIMSMKNSYAIRVQRLLHTANSKRVSMNIGSIVVRQGGGPFTTGSFDNQYKDQDADHETEMLDGLTSSAWASLNLGVATSFLKAYQIHTDFIDSIYGARPWNVTGKNDSGGINESSPSDNGRLPIPHIVRQLRNYLEEMILFMLSRSFYCSISHLEFKQKNDPIIPKHPRFGGRTSEEYMKQQEYKRIPQDIFSLAQCGLAIIRPLLVGGDKYQCCSSIHELHNLFESAIRVQFPIVASGIRNEREELYTQNSSVSTALGSLAFKTYSNTNVQSRQKPNTDGTSNSASNGGNMPSSTSKLDQEGKKLGNSDRIADINSLLDYLVVIQSYVAEERCAYMVEDVSPSHRVYLYSYPLQKDRAELPYLNGACFHLIIPDEFVINDNKRGTTNELMSFKEKETKSKWWRLVSTWSFGD